MRRRRIKFWHVVAVPIVAVLALGGTSAAAVAAPPYQTEATLTSLEFVADSVASGSSAELSGSWALPDNPTSPAGFVVALPEALQGRTDSFPLLDPQGVAMGQCDVGPMQIVCDFDSDYLAADPFDLSGNFNFWVGVNTEVVQDTETSYTFNGITTSVIVTPGVPPCTENCDFTGRDNAKNGVYNYDDNTIVWDIAVASGAEGAIGGDQIVVDDILGPDQEFITDYHGSPYPVLIRTNELGDIAGHQVPVNWVTAPQDQYTVDGGKVSFAADAGYFYNVRYRTQVTDGGAAGTYTNAVTNTVAGTPQAVTAAVVREGGGGTGTGTDVGRFSITKQVLWEDSPIEGMEYGGTFTVTSPTNVVTEGSFRVADGATWTSDEYETGSIVHLDEVLPTDPSNIRWADPVFSTNDFAVVGATTSTVGVTNQASLIRGVFSASKTLTGDAASLVPADTTFLLDYSYPAGEGFVAGKGTLELPADGTVVTSPDLPATAILTLTERKPDPVDGAQWAGSDFSSNTVTIAADVTTRVTVTNTLTREPSTPPATTPPAQLATTGPAPVVGGVVAAFLLIVFGALAVRYTRRANDLIA